MIDNEVTLEENINEDNAQEEVLEKSPDPERPIVFEEALEAILFAAGHPITYATLARVFEMTPGKVKDKVFEYSIKYNDPEIPRGVILLTYPDSCQLSTKQYYLNEIREALGLKRNGTLSTSSMEALAIVAYNQPVTRFFVDSLRRADSSYAMNNLIDRGLIESKGRLDVPGRPMLYGTTKDFLRSFGLKDISELPKTTDELLMAFEGAREDEKKDRGEVDELQLAVDIDSALPQKERTDIDAETKEAETETTDTVEEIFDEESAVDDLTDD